MTVILVATTDQVPPGQVVEVTVGDKTIALCNVEGRFYALDGICPHRYGPLGQGALSGERLVCPWHCWAFSVRSGEFDYNAEVRVETYDVIVEGNQIGIVCPNFPK